MYWKRKKYIFGEGSWNVPFGDYNIIQIDFHFPLPLSPEHARSLSRIVRGVRGANCLREAVQTEKQLNRKSFFARIFWYFFIHVAATYPHIFSFTPLQKCVKTWRCDKLFARAATAPSMWRKQMFDTILSIVCVRYFLTPSSRRGELSANNKIQLFPLVIPASLASNYERSRSPWRARHPWLWSLRRPCRPAWRWTS